MKIIMHIDMDSFFASVEVNENPKLKDVPLVICVYSGRTEDSGAVATSNYAARKYGVKSGLPIAMAKKILANVKGTVFLPVRKEHYQSISDEIVAAVEEKVDRIEVASIDEVYCDVSSLAGLEEAKDAAREIKQEVLARFGLTCSIGISDSKIASKIASDFNKPDGLTIVENPKEFLSGLPIGKIPGIGPKTEEKMREKGIERIGDIATFGKENMIGLLGEILGSRIHGYSNGIDGREVEEREKKQLSRLFTLKENSRDKDYVANNIYKAYELLKPKIEKSYKTFSIILVTTDLAAHTKSMTFAATPGDDEILHAIKFLTGEFLMKNDLDVRRAGARVSAFYDEKLGQKSLFDY